MKGKKKGTATVAVIGGVIVMLIVAIGTALMGQQAKKDTDSAVRRVSLLYLDELAGSREQVVEGNLQNKVNVIRTAIDLMTEEDLSDKAHMEAYQRRMKSLYSLDKFAFVDTEGLIYTSTGTQDNIGDYAFDYRTISEPDFSIFNLQSPNKQVIIAVPVRVPFQGKTLPVCFMAIDMSEMLVGLSMDYQSSDATFCNLYTRDGVSLTNQVLAGQAEETNLLEALKQADFEAGYSYEKVRADFTEGKRGVVSFSYRGVPETLSYVPIGGTDGFLTYLFRESVISGQISSISDGIITRSAVQSLLTVAVLLVMFLFIIAQNKKTARIQLEKETSDAENRIKREEMKQRLALQEELLSQKKQRQSRTG